MTDLVCNESVVPPPSQQPDAVIPGDGFYPEVDLAQLRRDQRIPETISAPRLTMAVKAAMVTVANDLAAWRAGLEPHFGDLESVPAPLIGSESRLLFLYRRALGCFARAELIERHRDVDTTSAGGRDLAELSDTVNELRRDGRHAVRDMIGRPRTTVELL